MAVEMDSNIDKIDWADHSSKEELSFLGFVLH